MSFNKKRPTFYNSNSIENQLRNGLYTVHDLCCGCNDPAAHLIYLLAPGVNPNSFTKEEKQKVLQCLGGDAPGTEEEDIGGIQEGELEKLFEEEIEEPTG